MRAPGACRVPARAAPATGGRAAPAVCGRGECSAVRVLAGCRPGAGRVSPGCRRVRAGAAESARCLRVLVAADAALRISGCTCRTGREKLKTPVNFRPISNARSCISCALGARQRTAPRSCISCAMGARRDEGGAVERVGCDGVWLIESAAAHPPTRPRARKKRQSSFPAHPGTAEPCEWPGVEFCVAQMS